MHSTPGSHSSLARPGSQRAFTLIEMLLVVSVIALLVALLLPAMAKAKQATHRTICSTKLHNMALANHAYMMNNRNTFPPHRYADMNAKTNWYNLLEVFGNTPDNSRCPAIEGEQVDYGVKWSWVYNYNYIGYGYNGFFLGLYSHPDNTTFAYIKQRAWTRGGTVVDPGKLITFGDSSPKTIGGVDHGVSLTLWWPYIHAAKEGVNDNRHGGAGVVSFADGHAEVVIDPNTKIHPPFDGSVINSEYWDPLQRRP